MRSKKDLPIKVLLAVIVIVTLAAMGRKLLDYHKGAEDYKEAAGIAQGGQVSAEPLPEDMDEYAKMLSELELAPLREVNDEVVGWIAIPDTEVFYPILQAEDNSFYLNYTWKKERSSVGAIFLDDRNPSDFSGFHSILYGHQMRNGSMFGGLHKYADENYLREHPVVYLLTDSGVQEYDIFAAYEAGVQDILYKTDVEETGRQQELVDYACSHAAENAAALPEADGHILTLSTCTGRGYATRWVVQAVLREEASA